jgi:hypothetical protein
LDADDVHDAREVVGQYVQGHLGSNPGIGREGSQPLKDAQ